MEVFVDSGMGRDERLMAGGDVVTNCVVIVEL
jgi:hypothetical protein